MLNLVQHPDFHQDRF